MSEVERSAAGAFDTWGRENLGTQKHRWFQESATRAGTRMWRHWSLREGRGDGKAQSTGEEGGGRR